MSVTLVHQTLHGYRRGHEFLAGSIRLPTFGADLVTRLSDLSGSITSGWDFRSYLTGYPIAGTQYFALARTWNDKTAARAGCVLTHTLLIPTEVWKHTLNPRVFTTLFANPEELCADERFKKPLQINVKNTSVAQAVSLSRRSAVDFVQKYHGEGHRPLVWFDCPEPEDAAWAIIRVLWPSLRAEFAWCTASLQPRSLDTRLLDLQFAPSAAYQRFQKIPRENFIASESDRSVSVNEPWCKPCAEWIFFGSGTGPVDAELAAFGPSLSEDPTLMRHLFLAKELLDRVNLSPTAGAGLLDVTEALAPKPDDAIQYKARVAKNALAAAMATTPDEALKCLFLIGDRLSNKAFLSLAGDLGSDLSSMVEKLSSRHVRESLVMPERVVTRSDITVTPYFRGLVEGITRCARSNPEDLTCLIEFDKTTPHLIALSPAIASGYLRGVNLVAGEQTYREALVGWITGFDNPTLRRSLREELLPQVHDERDIHLTEELLRDLTLDEVSSALAFLADGTNDFSPKKILAAIQELVARPFPEAVREWAFSRKRWSDGILSLVAATFDADQKGLEQVLEFNPRDEIWRAQLLAAFLHNCTLERVPGWFRDVARQSSDWLIPILSLRDRIPSPAVETLEQLLPELREVPIALQPSMLEVMSSLRRYNFWGSLLDITLRGAVSSFVNGELAEDICRAWFSNAWASKWVAEVTRSDLAAALIQPVTDQERRERAFRWMAIAPSSLYERQSELVPGLFWDLVSERRYGWTMAMSISWAETIYRVQIATPGSTSLRMCADVLRYGFDTTQEPVGAAVAAAFYPVYRAVCDCNWTPPEVSNLFGWFEWDKAKELRKGLVRAFIGSCWNAADLALAAREDELLLRKLIKRIFRGNNGNYVTTMLDELVNRPGDVATRTAEIVRELASDPDFHEPWD